CAPKANISSSKLSGSSKAQRSGRHNMTNGQGLQGPSRKASAPLGCASVATGACRRPLHETTPLTITALPTDTVTVTDPTHPLSGRTFPLVGITTKQRLGRVCVVWLYPGVERVIPLAATSLTAPPPPPSPCKLSVAGLHTLLAVVASLADLRQEDTH